MIGYLLAQIPAAGLDPITVGAIIGGLIISLMGGGLIGKKVTEGRVRISNNPLDVDIRKTYITREECIACQRETKTDLREMKALYDKIITLVMERDERATERTKIMGETLGARVVELWDRMSARFLEMEAEGAERRRRIHDKLNEHSDLLSRVDARTDVSRSIGKLGAAMMALAKKENN